MATIVYYNGLPVKLTKSYARKELARSKRFCELLKAKIETEQIDGAIRILERRREWVKTLENYLNSDV